MKFYTFGEKEKPAIMLFPRTCCHWKLNFGEVIHCFYAKKMGEMYLERYKEHFKNPTIHEFDMEHEELLVMYPEKWVDKIKEICQVSIFESV